MKNRSFERNIQAVFFYLCESKQQVSWSNLEVTCTEPTLSAFSSSAINVLIFSKVLLTAPYTFILYCAHKSHSGIQEITWKLQKINSLSSPLLKTKEQKPLLQQPRPQETCFSVVVHGATLTGTLAGGTATIWTDPTTSINSCIQKPITSKTSAAF